MHFPPQVRFGVLSWKKGTRRAGWVARGLELGADGWHADLSWWPGTGWGSWARRCAQVGWLARGSELGAGPDGWTPEGPDTESAGAGALGPETDSERAAGPDTEGPDTETGERRPDTESARERRAPTQRAPGPTQRARRPTRAPWFDVESAGPQFRDGPT